MVMGLLSSGWIALSEWTPFVVGRALLAQSTERRLSRWLSNPRIDVLHLYAALLRPVLGECPDRRLWVVLDTTVLWNLFCVVQLCWVYRGRTIPLAWKVLRHPSASVAFRDYRGVLGFVARRLRGGAVGRPGFPPRRVVALGRAHGGRASSRSLQTERGVIPPDGPGLWPADLAAVGGGSAL
jgi:hypothetical protein